MPQPKTEPLSGIIYDWPLGYPANTPGAPAAGWKPDMDANLLAIGQQSMPLHVLSRSLIEPPESPVARDVYIPAESASGAWEGQDGTVAVWDGAAWVFIAPLPGRLAVVEDEGVLCARLSSGWSTGININPAE